MPSSHAAQHTAAQLRQLSADALRVRADAVQAEIVGLRFAGAQKEKNVKKLKTLRHDRARMLTILREKQNEGGRA